ncbi:hypothetical protein [Nitrospirillum amazonense]|uniref:hypothetical protein n=1 Tax=Nitrospirillum amazonense TaxID=28077 RepID=UPI00119DB4BA|nr:hypothetical protein [Nitrospirillum amazonense]
MWKFPPTSLYAEDVEQAALTALLNFLEMNKGLSGEYYFSVNGSDPNDQIINLIKHKYPDAIIHKFSESKGYEFCLGVYLVGEEKKCAPYPLMDANFIAMPMWHVALVSAGVWGCGGPFWVFKAFGRWIVLSEHVSCT